MKLQLFDFSKSEKFPHLTNCSISNSFQDTHTCIKNVSKYYKKDFKRHPNIPPFQSYFLCGRVSAFITMCGVEAGTKIFQREIAFLIAFSGRVEPKKLKIYVTFNS